MESQLCRPLVRRQSTAVGSCSLLDIITALSLWMSDGRRSSVSGGRRSSMSRRPSLSDLDPAERDAHMRRTDESPTANPRVAEVDAQRALAQLMLEAKVQRWPRLMRPFAAEVKRRLLLHVDSCPSWAESGMCNTCCGLWARTAAWQEKTGAQIPQSSRAPDSADERVSSTEYDSCSCGLMIWPRPKPVKTY